MLSNSYSLDEVKANYDPLLHFLKIAITSVSLLTSRAFQPSTYLCDYLFSYNFTIKWPKEFLGSLPESLHPILPKEGRLMVVQKYHLQTLKYKLTVQQFTKVYLASLKMGLLPSILNKETLGQFRGHGEGNNPSWSQRISP